MRPDVRRTIRYAWNHTDVSELGPVLVVDDDASIRDLIEMALADSGYTVQTAPDGAAALEVIGHTRPSVILLDMRMPVMNGWEFARAYRGLPGPHVPIVVLTAARDAGQRAAEICAEAFLGKPFDLNDLLGIVAQYAATAD
jgi:CheY-like chemotaxis protein